MHKISTKVVTLRKCHLIQSSIRSRYTLTSSFNNNNSDYRRLRSSTATTSLLSPIFGDNSVHRYSISRDHYLFSLSQLRVLSYFPPSDCDDGHNSVRRRKHSNYYYHRHDHHVGHDRWSLLSRRHFASQPSQSAGGDQPPQSASNQQPKKVDTDVEKVKRPLMKRIVDELVHYYHGFRLLFIDIRICARLLWQVVRGFDLSRREREQLVRTTADIFRLVPFMVFIIVPFMELALPIFVKLFPNLLPSTFQTTKDKDAKVKQQLKVKLEMAKFLQDTLEEMSLKSEGESHSEKAKEFAEFFNKIRKSGEQASNEDIIRFSKLFEDEITLDSLNRSQLTALCRLLELKPIGTNNFLRFQLRMRLRSLRADDKMITNEGIDSLSVSELQQACRARGMRALGLPADRLRTQLSQWLELSLNEKIPASLLLLSRVLYLPENLPATDQLKATIQALPETAATEAKYKIGESEGKVDNKTKIELIRQEEEAIKREREEEAEALKEEIAKKETLVDKAPIMESSTLEMATDSVGKEGQDEKKDLSREDIESLENVIDSKGIAIEKEELRDLQEEMDEYKEDLKEAAASMQAEALIRESKGAKRLGKKVGKMIAKMDELIKDLESKKESLQHGIETLAKKGEDEKLKAKQEEFVNLEELLEAARHVSSIDDKTKVEKVVDVLKIMDIDHDGKIEVDHIVKVLELVDHENIRLSPSQMRELVELVMQEEKLEEEAKFKMSKDKEKERSTSV